MTYTNKFIGSFLLVASLGCLSNAIAEPTSDERIMKSIGQILGSVSLKDGLANDPMCKGKTYRKFSLNEFVQAVAQKDKKVAGDKENFQAQIASVIADAIKEKLPNGKTVGQSTYDTMVLNIKNTLKAQNGQNGNYCDSVNEASEGLYQKAIDNIKLIQSNN